MTSASEQDWWRQLLASRSRLPAPAASPEAGLILASTAPSARLAAAGVARASPEAEILAPALTAVAVTPIRVVSPAVRLLARPGWTVATAVPQLVVTPAPAATAPLRQGDFLLWPDPVAARTFVSLAVPRLLDFSLTVQVTLQPDRSLKITGGTATLTVSVYPVEDLTTLTRYRQDWSNYLATRVTVKGPWNFPPQTFRNLQAALDLPAGYTTGPPRVSTSAVAGTATFLIDLSETGVLAWKGALEQRSPGSIQGVCRVTVNYFGQVLNRVTINPQELSAPLGTLLAARGPADVHVIYPQQTVQGTLVVVGNDLLQSAAVSLRPSMGQAPASQVFGPDGGQVQVSVTAQDVAAVTIDWTAQVAFLSKGWPVIPATGQLNPVNGWTDMIKPDSWLANYTFMAVLVDAQGKPVPFATAGSDYHVQGVLNFTAPYLPSGVLTATFLADNQLPVLAALPRYPGRPPGDLVLTVFATRSGVAGNSTRKLSPDELAVVALIYPNARVEIRTAQDALPELSTASQMLGLLQQME